MNEKKPPISLKTEIDKGDVVGGRSALARDENLPLLGLFAVGFAVLSIFILAPVFGPLGLILGIIALFVGQIGLGVWAILLSVIGMITSYTLMTFLGLGLAVAWLGF
ncbi:MAG: hypothetical protein NUV50_10055 [Rhodospirillales bacterium]|nr:hypothetical protein [Rhodospirillales bacterium]